MKNTERGRADCTDGWRGLLLVPVCLAFILAPAYLIGPLGFDAGPAARRLGCILYGIFLLWLGCHAEQPRPKPPGMD